MSNVWSREFELRHYEVDFRGELATPYLSRLFQEAAGLHAVELKIDNPQLASQNLAWVVSKFHVRLEPEARLPRWRERVRVETWRSGLERLLALRDYRMTDTCGTTIAVATCFWAMIDTQRRRMVMLPSFVTENYPVDAERALSSPFEKLPALEQAEHQSQVHARLSDIDENGHVNNAAYVSWLLESLPQNFEKAHRLAEFEIIYRNEVLPGDTVKCESQAVAGSGRLLHLHRLVREGDAREIVQARTRWRP